MVTMAQSAANWRNTHTRVDRTPSLTHLHQHGYSHDVRSASLAIAEFRIDFYFEGSLFVCSLKASSYCPANRTGSPHLRAFIFEGTWS